MDKATRDASTSIPAQGPHLNDQNKTAESVRKVQQPKPQALQSKSATSSIQVSTRQKGNPILEHIKNMPWEWADIPADYVLGATTCVLFLSLKYHKLHPEYVYTRIKGLAGKYNLRVVLTMVDIPAHEESLKELSKTSLVNNITIVLCWSSQEAGRYLELYKSCEYAAPTSIRAHQSTSYQDKVVEFITVPRNINKTDAFGLISSFGSIRTAVNAPSESIALVDGWGEKKVQRWCTSVRKPFRMQKAAKRGLEGAREGLSLSRENSLLDYGGVAQLPRQLLIRSPTNERPEAQNLSICHTTPNQALRTSGEDYEDKDARLTFLESNEVVSIRSDHQAGQATTFSHPQLSEGVSQALKRLRGDT